ncbi:carbonic anhydrase [Herbaspirillum sp. RV1423]|uniref:carbonic anhydrase n=1 Tax=Herbaspirillum sp. RV1423 TaxID=1443993 RepID=UPI0004B8E1DD|nr:carbonic anhydrase family protein [Herbaspirillum sp. RV1423]
MSTISFKRCGTYFFIIAFAFASRLAFGEEGEHFDYDHQADWHAVHGDMESPVNIEPAKAKVDKDDDDDDNIRVFDVALDGKVVDNGHSIQINLSHGDSATIRGRRFQLVQFHFHAASEHTIDGEHFPLEGHFVYKAKNGRLAVIAVLYREGKGNAEFDRILQQVVRGQSASVKSVNINKLLPAHKNYYHYLGSLTTPPLTENVEWYVLDRKMELSGAQIERFKSYYAHNNRDVQPLNERVVLHYVERKKVR